MRHMYDRDGNIPYAGKPRASRRWQGSGTRSQRIRMPRETKRESIKAQEVALDQRTHQERIRDILNSSKWSNPAANREG